MSAPDVSPGKLFGFELQGALAASRNLGALSGRLPQLQERAIGTLRRRLPVVARRDIQQEYAIKAQRVNQDLLSRISPTGIRLTGKFRGIGLTNFTARQLRRGVTATELRGKRSLREGAFLARLLGGGIQAVERYGAKRVMTTGRYKGKRRQPLEVLYGPTVAQMLRKGRRPERIVDAARGILGAEMQRLTESVLRRSGAPT